MRTLISISMHSSLSSMQRIATKTMYVKSSVSLWWCLRSTLVLTTMGAGLFWGTATASETRICIIKGPDGESFPCTVYPPLTTAPKRAGLVVHLYGSDGSHLDYNAGRPPFEEMRRILAERGYWLVIPELGPRHWMNDAATVRLDATIAEMVRTEHIAPSRVHLLGTSMGGTCSLIYTMAHPGKIRSVVAIFPITDLICWLDEAPTYRAIVDMAHGLTPAHEGDALRSLSPLWNVPAFRGTPIYLLHGDHDLTVPLHHSRDFAEALLQAGEQVIYREARAESHRDEIARPFQIELAEFLTKED